MGIWRSRGNRGLRPRVLTRVRLHGRRRSERQAAAEYGPAGGTCLTEAAVAAAN